MSTMYAIFWELSFLVPDNSDEFQLMKIARIDSFALLGHCSVLTSGQTTVFFSPRTDERCRGRPDRRLFFSLQVVTASRGKSSFPHGYTPDLQLEALFQTQCS